MLNWSRNILNRFGLTGDVRTIKAKKNILASFFIKGLSIIIGFLMVPLTINYVNPTRYGIWLTLSSFIGWFSFFDIGLGNGLRNKFAEARAKGKLKLARIYISTTYAILTLIIIPVLVVFMLINPFLNWVRIFNTPPELGHELVLLMAIVFCFFCMKFVVQLVTTVLTADQKPALGSLYNLIGNLISLIWIFILTKTTEGSLLQLGIALSISPVIALIIASIVLYSGSYRRFSPNIRYVKFKYSRDLINIGVKFFIIQITAIVVYTSTNMIISQLYGPAEVTPYNIAYKLLGTVMMIFSIIQVPFWSAYTDAYHRNEIDWIRTTNHKLIKIWAILAVGLIILMALSPYIYHFWVGDTIKIPFMLTVVIAVYYLLNTWNSIFVLFLNGAGKIRLQLVAAIIESLVFIPLALLFSRVLNLGIIGIVLASCIPMLAGALWTPIQFSKIINNTAKGIWSR